MEEMSARTSGRSVLNIMDSLDAQRLKKFKDRRLVFYREDRPLGMFVVYSIYITFFYFVNYLG